MAVVTRVAAVALVVAALAACYDPAVRDCVVSCAGPGDCAGGQVCGDDGWCASPAAAGTCEAALDAPAVDGPSVDAPVVDADTDAPAKVDATLRLAIEGRGRLETDLSGVECSSNAQGNSCDFTVEVGETVVVSALEANPSQSFEAWTSPTCADAVGPTCVVTIAAPVTLVSAQFE